MIDHLRDESWLTWPRLTITRVLSQGSILAYAGISVASKEIGNVRDLLQTGDILPLSVGDSAGQFDQNYNHLGIRPTAKP